MFWKPLTLIFITSAFGDWEEQQWQQTQLSELCCGPKVDNQIDRKCQEKTLERKIKPSEDTSEMKWAVWVVRTRRERQNQNKQTTSHEWRHDRRWCGHSDQQEDSEWNRNKVLLSGPSTSCDMGGCGLNWSNTNLLVSEHKELKILFKGACSLLKQRSTTQRRKIRIWKRCSHLMRKTVSLRGRLMHWKTISRPALGRKKARKEIKRHNNNAWQLGPVFKEIQLNNTWYTQAEKRKCRGNCPGPC